MTPDANPARAPPDLFQLSGVAVLYVMTSGFVPRAAMRLGIRGTSLVWLIVVTTDVQGLDHLGQ